MHDLVIRGGTVVDGTGAPATTADVAVDGGRITEVGKVDGRGEQEIDADGASSSRPAGSTSTPTTTARSPGTPRSRRRAGTASPPSSWATAASGSRRCAPTAEDFLIELMEGVEDIPGTALHEGIDWDWESFPEYLDALDKPPRTIDIAAQVPHAALRAYVMGERAHERRRPPTTSPRWPGWPRRRCGPAPSASPRRARSCTARSTGSCPAPTPRPTSCSPSATPSAGPATACSSSCPTTRAASPTGCG